VRRFMSAILCLTLVAVGSCSKAKGADHEPIPGSGVSMELVPGPSGRCCRVVTVNRTDAALNVGCRVIAYDTKGHLLHVAIVPGAPPGHRRSSGFWAPPGRHVQGFFDIPIDPTRGRYEGPCNRIAWHGAPPI